MVGVSDSLVFNVPTLVLGAIVLVAGVEAFSVAGALGAFWANAGNAASKLTPTTEPMIATVLLRRLIAKLL